ncbi:non-ribosomal peptide synthetase [Engelhardtia mirabilis]|uniref:Tyrocidine synthase 3 n=1 Tax=Engelhardtia mirabilis TaxID=2528011 RepID=A0A518BEP1_9BACT|nr:Tyrocidine synthase 3 [Planctomycetes bacterium Pla133]QDU99776.1 Tyrocidine synthase 3 [Planctomycetes bacterium Pla86]
MAEDGAERPQLDAARLELLRRRRAAAEREAQAAATIPKAPAGPAPLSFAQERFWFLQRLEPESAEYNVAGAVRLEGELDRGALRAAFDGLLARHAALRTGFPAEGGVPRQVVAPDASVALVSETAHGAEGAWTAARLRGFALEPFDLERPPLLRALHLELSPTEHLVAAAMHHIATDGWSVRIIVRELAQLYARALVGGEGPPPLPVTYVDYAAWQRRESELLRLRALAQDWRHALADATTGAELPLDRPRPALVAREGDHRRVSVTPGVADGLRGLARAEGTTLFVVLLSSFQVLLHRICRQEDLIVGTPWAGRDRREIEGVVGAFVNTLPLRSRHVAREGFSAHLARTKAVFRDAVAVAELPFEQLVAELSPPRDPGRTPLFDVFFDMGVPRPTPPWHGLRATEVPVETGLALFDLSLGVEDLGEGGLAGRFDFRTALFEGATIERIGRAWLELLAAAVREPRRPLEELPLVSASDRRVLLEAGRGPRLDVDLRATVHRRFGERARRAPTATALREGSRVVTYAELDAQSDRLAGHLVAAGVEADVPVATFLPRSIDAIVAVLAIWKAGGAYLPLDPEDPVQRTALLLADADARLVLTHADLRAALPATSAVGVVLDDDATLAELAARPDGPLEVELEPTSIAYVIYTSGSTGRPKGVAVPHRALANHLASGAVNFAFGTDDRFLLRTPFTFDASLWEIVHPLTSGAELVVAPPGVHRDPRRLLQLVADCGITVLQAVPSMLRSWLEGDGLSRCTALRHLICAGERLSHDLAERFFEVAPPGAALHNLYGPSEACIDATWFTCAPGDRRGRGSVPIGRPLHNVEAHVVDGSMQPLPIGMSGELLVGGAGLARGYLGDPLRTAERFLDDPLGSGRMYRTGDLVRRLEGGELEFLGRVDQQVKIAGQRIELGEIEAVLAQHPGVREAAVDARPGPGGLLRLLAWVIPAQADGAETLPLELQAYLAARLPRHMCPAAIGTVNAMPLAPSEKLDRRALPEIEVTATAPSEPPRGDLERRIATLVGELLEVDAVGRDDDFFGLGGQSLLAAQLAARLRDETGVDVDLLAFFERPTVSWLARTIECGAAGTTETPNEPLAGDPPLSFAQERLWILDRLEPGSTHYNVLGGLRLEGPVDSVALQAALRAVQARHSVWRTSLVERDGRPVQVVAGDVELVVAREDLRGSYDPRSAAHALAEAEARHRFDLAAGPLVRAQLWTLGADQHWLVLNQHHAITDGASLGILARELGEHYRAAIGGESSSLPTLQTTYGELAARQRRALTEERRGALLRAAHEELDGAPETVALPTDRPRPARRDHRGESLEFRFEAQLSSAVRAFARARRTTPFAVLLGSFAALLHRMIGEGDFVVGTAVANRNAPGAEHLLGLFVNAVPLRLSAGGDQGLAGVVDGATAALRRGLARAELPFEQLVEELAPARDPSRAPLFQISFDTLGTAAVELDFGSVRATELEFPGTRAKLDLAIAIDERGEDLAARIEFATDVFDRATVERLWSHFARLLAQGLAAPERGIGELKLLDESQRRELVELGRGAAAPAGEETCAHRLVFGGQARPRAVVWSGGAWSLAELEQRARRCAASLAARGVGPGAIVTLECGATPARIAAFLGVWLCGAAWLVLDPADPEPHRARLAERAGVRLRLDSLGVDALAAGPAPEADLDRGSPEAPAYVIATSGTTGEPKLAVIPHRALAHHARAAAQLHGIGAGDRVLHRIPAVFDAALLEWFTPLAAGAELHLADEAERSDPAAYLRRAAQVGVTLLVGVPAWIGALVADRGRIAQLDGLRRILCGGEAMLAELPRRVAELGRPIELFNLYGPAECCIDAAFHRCEASESGPPPLGRPFPGAHLAIIDARGALVPRGVVGELVVGGRGVGLGYLGSDELTAQRFEVDPFGDGGARRYRTGDLARWRADGSLEFVGRADREVKVRGRRVEPGAIEAALGELPGVREAAVTARRAGSAIQLVAHLAGAGLEVDRLRAEVARRLPEAWIPARWDLVERLPRLVSGKLDLVALARREGQVPSEAQVAPRNDLERRIAALFAQVLGVEAPGVTADFFDLGGSSLSAIDLAVRLRDELGVELPLPDFMATPTIESAARLVDGGESAASEPVGPARLRAEARLPEEVRPAEGGLRPHPPRRVLLTGATGFLGAHLLRALVDAGVERVDCLVRASSPSDARRRLEANLERYRLRSAEVDRALHPLAGDLAARGLGIERAGRGGAADAARSPETSRSTGPADNTGQVSPDRLPDSTDLDSIDAIVHCGAAVDFVRGYDALAPINVGGTLEVLRLACRTGAAVHFISTIGVAAPPNLGPDATVFEDGDLEQLIGHTEGYEQSKWVAEALVREAGRRGLPVAIHRPGRVAGSATTGIWSPDDLAARAIRGSFALGLAPAIDLPVDVTPVDVLARAIAHLVRCRRPDGATYHLLHPTPTPFDALYRRAIERGLTIRLVDQRTWRAAAITAANGNRSHPLFPLLTRLRAATEAGDDRDLVPDRDLPLLDRSNAERDLARLDEPWPLVDNRVLDRWAEHFRRGVAHIADRSGKEVPH